MTRAWLSVIGIDEAGLAGLGPGARGLVDRAEILIGGERHLALVPDDGQTRITWPRPLLALAERLSEYRGRATVVLATGDPMAYGIGSTIVRYISPQEMTIIPAVSAFSLAAARLGWPLHRVETITLHGRPTDTLAAHLYPGARWLILAHDRETPQLVAQWLRDRNFGRSSMVALSHMGGQEETRLEGRAENWSEIPADFHTLAVVCRWQGTGASHGDWQSLAAGLPDDVFEHDGQMTKRIVRATALAKLRPHPGGILWDIGAGSGSIGIEWLRLSRGGRVIALEPDVARQKTIAANAARLGVPEIEIVGGRAPQALGDLAGPPDAVFFGGGMNAEGLDYALAALPPGGRLVANGVTLESEALLLALHQKLGGELERIAVAGAQPVGGRTGWRPAMPVTQYALIKEAGHGT